MSGDSARPEPERDLRHDLRTLIGQTSGYSELLLEAAEEHGWGEAVPDLLAIQSSCKELLACTDQLRGPVPAATVAALGHATIALLEYTQRVRSHLVAVGDDVALTDIEAIARAGRRLLALVSSGLGLADAPGPTPSLAVGTPRPRPSHEPASPELTDAPGKLLVVDDDACTRDLLRRRLERLGCSVELAAHGRQALEMLGASPFDVVLLDIVMPEMDGFETLGHVHADPTLRHVPVIVLSAHDDLDSAIRCIELGAEDYLAKPIDPLLLRARVEACLEKKRLRDKEAAYLREVARVTAAAADIEAAVFDPTSLADLATRTDALGQLVRVVRGVAEAYTRQAVLTEENARLLGVLREKVEELERSRQLIASAEERLRQEIAELLHSRVQNQLLLAGYRLEDCRELMADQPARARTLLDQASRQIQEVREHHVREVSHLLHPSIIQVGLAPAVERLADDFLQHFTVDLNVDNAVERLDDPIDNRLPETVRLAAYRVLQEALGNAARHAHARRVEITLGLCGERLAVSVRDDGQGFDPRLARAGLGLSSIAARVGCVGGTWRVSSAPGQGAMIEAFLPLDPSDSEVGQVPAGGAPLPDTKRLS